jgi:IS30 family transposase
MQKKYFKQMGLEEREEISRFLALGYSFRHIGELIGRHHTTVMREVYKVDSRIKRYRAARGYHRTLRRRKYRGRPYRLSCSGPLRDFVLAKLELCWSPQQIVQMLKIEYPDNINMRISHEAIYSYLYVLPKGQLRKELLSYLRQQRKLRRRRIKNKKSNETRGKLPNMVSIEERPAEVASRTVPGHWEGDVLVGKYQRTALGTLVERTTRTVILVPLRRFDAESTRKAYARVMKKIPKEMRLTLTYDQGKEMSQHQLFAKAADMKVYFAHSGSPWERGTNENTNGLIRQFFPKGTDFSKVNNGRIRHVQDLLNGRPRKVLDWRTPFEKFNEIIQSGAIKG